MLKRIWGSVSGRLRQLDARWRLPVRGFLLLALAGLVAGGYFVGRMVYVNVLFQRIGWVDLELWDPPWTMEPRNQVGVRSDRLASKFPRFLQQWIRGQEILLSPVIDTLELNSPVDAETLRSVVQIGQPRRVELSGSWITTKHVAAVSESRDLRYMFLNLSGGSESSRWNAMSRCKKLEFLSVTTESRELPPDRILELISVESLTTLYLSECRLSNATAAAICRLADSRSLHIELSFFHAPADVYSVFRSLPESATLDVNVPRKFHDDCLTALAGVSSLRRLDLGKNPLGKNSVTDRGFLALKWHSRLEELEVSGQTELTQASWAVLSTLPRLTHLDVGNTSFNESWLARMEECRSLRVLEVESFSDISEEAANALRKRRPDLDIYFVGHYYKLLPD